MGRGWHCDMVDYTDASDAGINPKAEKYFESQMLTFQSSSQLIYLEKQQKITQVWVSVTHEKTQMEFLLHTLSWPIPDCS